MTRPSSESAPSDPTGLFQIGEVADRVGLSIRTLRHWHDVGLVTPTARSQGGFRLYSEADVERLLLVKSMKPMEFTLEEMAELLALVEQASAAARTRTGVPRTVSEQLDDYAARTVQRIQRIERDHGDASQLLDRIRAGIASTREQRSPADRRATARS